MTISDKIIVRLALALWLAAFGGVAQAQATRYITDEIQAPVRRGAGEEHRVVTFLSSGTPVEVLEENAAAGYSLVRSDGLEGWVLTRQLMSIPSGRARLAAAEQRFEERETALKRSEQEARDLRALVKDLEGRNQALAEQARALEDTLTTLRAKTAEPLATEQQNRKLQQAVIEERETVRRLLDENDALKAQAARDWFLIGAGLTLGSLLLGVIIARIPWRRRRSWGEL